MEDVTVDAAGTIYVTGETFSPDFPSIGPTIGSSGGSEAFVARLGPQGLDYATRFGSSQDDYAQGLAVTPSGDVYVSGRTGCGLRRASRRVKPRLTGSWRG